MFCNDERIWFGYNMNEYTSNLFSVENKVVIVTGASRGIGAEIAFAFVNACASVIAISRSEVCDKQELSKYYQSCDITDYNSFQSICENTYSQYGKIDILINVAGISLPFKDNKGEMDRFVETISTNLNATFNCCSTVSKKMLCGGSIINISSIGALFGFPGNPGYVASKGGVSAMTKALAVDYGGKSIRVNNIVPGYTKTDMTLSSYNNHESHQQRLSRMIFGRWGETKDIIGAAIFLGSDASSYITGTDIIVDGGWSVY